ncbi:hypothetical protein FRC02_002103 [Tulasnella sp. 418]|nr:hypothetical protein FRC02_002103 [Tulasnella sp. 418]
MPSKRRKNKKKAKGPRRSSHQPETNGSSLNEHELSPAQEPLEDFSPQGTPPIENTELPQQTTSTQPTQPSNETQPPLPPVRKELEAGGGREDDTPLEQGHEIGSGSPSQQTNDVGHFDSRRPTRGEESHQDQGTIFDNRDSSQHTSTNGTMLPKSRNTIQPSAASDPSDNSTKLSKRLEETSHSSGEDKFVPTQIRNLEGNSETRASVSNERRKVLAADPKDHSGSARVGGPDHSVLSPTSPVTTPPATATTDSPNTQRKDVGNTDIPKSTNPKGKRNHEPEGEQVTGEEAVLHPTPAKASADHPHHSHLKQEASTQDQGTRTQIGRSDLGSDTRSVNTERSRRANDANEPSITDSHTQGTSHKKNQILARESSPPVKGGEQANGEGRARHSKLASGGPSLTTQESKQQPRPLSARTIEEPTSDRPETDRTTQRLDVIEQEASQDAGDPGGSNSGTPSVQRTTANQNPKFAHQSTRGSNLDSRQATSGANQDSSAIRAANSGTPPVQQTNQHPNIPRQPTGGLNMDNSRANTSADQGSSDNQAPVNSDVPPIQQNDPNPEVAHQPIGGPNVDSSQANSGTNQGRSHSRAQVNSGGPPIHAGVNKDDGCCDSFWDSFCCCCPSCCRGCSIM